jgi:hypothetical protein
LLQPNPPAGLIEALFTADDVSKPAMRRSRCFFLAEALSAKLIGLQGEVSAKFR